MTDRTDPPRAPDPEATEGLKVRLGENVRLLRARLHITQEELASRADIHRTQMTLIESGKRLPRADTLLKLAAGLEVDMTTLFGGIAYRPRLFSAARGEFEISDRPLLEIAGHDDADRPAGAADR
jgi:transcriptional regulator with XRE-family HTH domain